MVDVAVNMNGISMLVLFGILQGVLIILLFCSKNKFKEHKLLVYALLILLFIQIHSFLLRSGSMLHFLFLLNTNVPFMLLIGPLFLLYSKYLSREKVPLIKQVIHFLPFGFYLVYSFNFFLQEPAFKYNILVQLLQVDMPYKDFSQPFSSDPWMIQGWVVVEFIALHLLIYGGYTLYGLIKRNPGKIKLVNSKKHWLIFLNGILVFGGLILFMSEGGVVNGKVFFHSPFPDFAVDLFSTFAMYATTGYLLINPRIIQLPSKKYSKSSLSREFIREKLNVIKRTIEDSKLYLNPNFSLDLIAQKTGLSKHHISQIINSEMNGNFFDLTNHYRIEEAKRVLKKSDYIKMEQLAYQLGYKSKSSFYNAFKKATSLTPSQYLIQCV